MSITFSTRFLRARNNQNDLGNWKIIIKPETNTQFTLWYKKK